MIASIVGYILDSAGADPRTLQAIEIPAGETGDIGIQVNHRDGTPFNLTGGQLLFTVDKDGTQAISRQATITSPTAGVAHFPLVIADTLALHGTGHYDVWYTDASGSRYQAVLVSSFIVGPAEGQPGQAVTVPASQQPLAQGPPGPPGPTGPSGGVPPTRLIATGGGLQGGGDLSADRTISLTDTGIAAGTYGGASSVGVVTLDQKGRVVGVGGTPIQIAESQVTNLPGDLSAMNSAITSLTSTVTNNDQLALHKAGTETITGNKTHATYSDWTSIAQPTTPAAGTARMYCSTVRNVDGVTVLNNLGTPVVLGRDAYFAARNVSGASIAAGAMVFINGAAGGLPRIDLAQADSSLSKMPAVGIAPVAIPNNTNGIIMTAGVITMDTGSWGAGDEIFVSPTVAGGLTNANPAHPQASQHVGTVGVANASAGELIINLSPFNINKDGTNQTAFKIGPTVNGTLFTGWNSVTMGAQLTAAASITPTSALHHVTGATPITTINTANVATGARVNLRLIADGGTITLNTGGNIARAVTITQNAFRDFVWDGTAWYAAT